MSRKSRSARGQIVDFDLLAIKQQLATAPVPVGVDARRRFIDEKDGIRVKQTQNVKQPKTSVSAFTLTEEGIAQSEAATDQSE